MPEFGHNVQKPASTDRDERNQDHHNRDTRHGDDPRERAGLILFRVTRLGKGSVVPHTVIPAMGGRQWPRARCQISTAMFNP